MRQLFVALSVFAVVLASARNAAAQLTDDCSFPDTSTIEGLMARVFLVGDSPTPPTIRIVNMSYVCQMSGMFRDTYRGISLLAKYECGGSPLCPVPVEGVVEKSQFDFACSNGKWVAGVIVGPQFALTENPNSTFDTPLRTDCSFCISSAELESLGSTLVSDELTHCVACSDACNVGAMKCFGTGSHRCCNFYNSSDGKCLQECQADRLVTDDFDCTAFAHFTRTQYVFSEDQGSGSVMVEGSDGIAVTVSGGPPPSQIFVRISGSAVDETITALPATVTFNISDDDSVVEANEVYFLTLTSDDPDVLFQQDTTQIMITDDDRMVIGYAMSDYQFVEGAPMTEAMIRIFGDALQEFMFVFVGENMAEELTASAGYFSQGAILFPPLDNPDNDIALQDDRTFQIGLAAAPGFENVVVFGANIESDQTFTTTNVTITDNDTVSVTFDQDIYTVSESGSVTITLSLDRGIDTAFTVIVRPEASPDLLPGTSRSTPTTSFTESFQVSSDVQSSSFQLMPIDDNVPNEPNEQFQMSISFVSDPRVVADDIATVIIVDEDFVDVGFAATSYTFIENEGTGTVTVTGPSNLSGSLSVSVVGGPGVQAGVRISGTDVSETLTSFPATISFTINDDEAAVEAVERYVLTLIPSDPAISINRATTEIVILNNDRIVVGFAYETRSFAEGAVGDATVLVFGEALQEFSVVYVQEFGGISDTLEFPAQDYPSGSRRLVPIVYSDNDIALEDDVIFQIGLEDSSDIVDIGGFIPEIGGDSPFRTFGIANITIRDDDVVIVGFREPEYTFSEEGESTVIIMRSSVSARPYTVNISAEVMPTEFVFPSARPYLLDGILQFGAGSVAPFVEYELDIYYDNVALEDSEVFRLVLSSPSDSRIRIGGRLDVTFYPTADVTILDDDIVIVGFSEPEYTFTEGELATVTIARSFVTIRPFAMDVSAETMPAEFVFPSAIANLLAGTVEFGNSSVSRFIDYALDIQNDDVALEDSEVFTLVLSSLSDSRVQLGGIDEDDNVVYFDTTLITIVDDDLAQLSFLTNLFVFPENRQTAMVFVILRNPIVDGRSVTVTVVEEDRGNMQFVVQSIGLPDVNLTFSSTSASAQSITPIYTDDLVGLEDTESLDFVLKAVSDPAQIDFSGRIPRANVTVLDNEEVTVRIDGAPTRIVDEGDSVDICVSKDIESVRGVNFELQPLPGSAGRLDYSPSHPQSGTLSTEPNAQQCISFYALVDNVMEGNETFTISLTVQRLPRGTGELLTTNEEVVITIMDTIITPTTPTPTIPTFPPTVEADTVIGDPLFTVPILSARPFRLLCYEIRGAVDQYFNFISDACVSVNAHYVQHSLATETRPLHVIDEIAIRAVDSVGNCVNLRVNRNGCSTFVNNSPITVDYSSNGIKVTLSPNRSVVNVPNCNDADLEFNVDCQVLNGIDMLRFEVERGVNLRESSHGLLGQFWNVAIDVDEFTGDLRDGEATDDVYIVTVKPQGTAQRQFPAWLEVKAWDNRRTCLYAGNQNGGTVFELEDAHDSLIEGVYTDYITGGPYSTDYKFSHFESNRCI